MSHDATICPLICVFYSRHSRQTAFHDASPPDNSMHSVETMLRVGYGLYVCRWVEIQNWSQAAQVICFCFVRTFCLHQGRSGMCGVTDQKAVMCITSVRISNLTSQGIGLLDEPFAYWLLNSQVSVRPRSFVPIHLRLIINYQSKLYAFYEINFFFL